MAKSICKACQMTVHEITDEMNSSDQLTEITSFLSRIADALESMAGTGGNPGIQLGKTNAYHWEPVPDQLKSVEQVNRVELTQLKGIDNLRDQLLRNTLQFANGHGANNALLWGARGMGKSSLVKAVHAAVDAKTGGDQRLVLVEINREDLGTLPQLLKGLAVLPARFIVFCDDLSFDRDETSYKSLKTVLDGGLEGRPANVIFYATSNRRHLMPRDMIENEQSTAINPHEAVEEKISLSDRFGLWLGFHNCDQDTYLAMVMDYAAYFGLDIDQPQLRARAIEWSATRGARSGRVAIQFVRSIAGELGQSAG